MADAGIEFQHFEHLAAYSIAIYPPIGDGTKLDSELCCGPKP
jgi:hypothetical protein